MDTMDPSKFELNDDEKDVYDAIVLIWNRWLDTPFVLTLKDDEVEEAFTRYLMRIWKEAANIM